ncbi:3'(2'),5'-bisphosphate nucleotidase CysQ [Massilia sp. TS11]|uniref:3'(2'),5'-bisphosphate nucleotidase CysQ n=1 Tax=Massilia sp. TS11 TaxID=2908003 RepID=UPI001EDC3E7C|nr:3'(2'),5'-bisphosphate nucleotidase CysQ [Massilia sp. TS11]MCG2582838.1 3'(2'),5'-bisphosphate nucleotidase CysQ [Massilia sp. TS11]
MHTVDIAALEPALLELVDAAGQAIMAVYTRADGAVQVSHKADASPLTEADLAAHQILATGLARLTPAIPVVSEEGADDEALRTGSPVFWLIDPLDGTKEFLARNGEMTVNLALVVQGRPVWGIVQAPALGLSYGGGRGLGAWRLAGGQRSAIAVQPLAAGPLRVVASKSHLNDATRAFIAALGEVSLVQAGSSLKLCRVAEGSADVYPRLGPTCEWDTAAAQAVLEGAGGVVVDLQDQPLSYGKPDVLNPHFVASAVPLRQLLRG